MSKVDFNTKFMSREKRWHESSAEYVFKYVDICNRVNIGIL